MAPMTRVPTTILAVMAIVSIPGLAAGAVTLQLAQSHVLPAPMRDFQGLNLADGMDDLTLHLVGGRSVFAIVEFGDVTPTNPQLSVYNDALGIGSATVIPLADPSHLPPTYGDANSSSVLDGVPFSTTAYSANISSSLVSKGLHITVSWDGGSPLVFADIVVGAPTEWELISLPMYYYGASPTMTGYPPTGNGTALVTLTPEVVGIMPEANRRELAQRLPIASFKTSLHPARYLKSDCVIVNPRGNPQPRRVCGDDVDDDGDHDTDAVSAGSMKILAVMLELDAIKPLCDHVFAPVVIPSSVDPHSGADGLGGGKRGAGNREYRGRFLHEQIHGFAFYSHGNLMYDGTDEWATSVGLGGQRLFPYEKGSAKGSAWAYDNSGYFYDVYAKTDECRDPDHTEHLRVDTDPAGAQRCYKQDVMAAGGSDREEGLNYGFVTDFTAAYLQRWFEGYDQATTGSAWRDFTLLSRGCVHKGKGPSGGPGMWNVTSQSFDDYVLPEIDTPKHLDAQLAVAYITINCAELQCDAAGGYLVPPSSTSATTYIYEPMSYVGQMREIAHVDDESTFDRFHHTSAWKDGRWEQDYSRNGCDFIVTFHFADGSRNRTLVPFTSDGFRAAHNPASPFEPDATILSDSDSLIEMGVGTLGEDPDRVDLEYLPQTCILGAHSRQPQLLTSWVRGVGETFAPPPPTGARAIQHELSIEFKLVVPTGYSHCAVERTHGLVRVIEKAVYAVIGGDAGGAAAGIAPTLPPLSSVRLACICAKECEADCASEFIRPLPIVPAPPDPTHAPPSSAAVPWVPICGCTYDEDIFDESTRTCNHGTSSFLETTLTKVPHPTISGVYHYEDAAGNKMRIDRDHFVEIAPEQIEPDPSRDPVENAVALCRATLGCVGFDFKPDTNRTRLMNMCMQPCYEHDTDNGRVAYHVDYDNVFGIAPEDRTVQNDAIYFRVLSTIPGEDAARAALAKLENGWASIFDALADDSQFLSAQIPWAVDASTLILTSVSVANNTLPPQPPSADAPPNSSPSNSSPSTPAQPRPPPSSNSSLIFDDVSAAGRDRSRHVFGVLLVGLVWTVPLTYATSSSITRSAY